MNLICQLGEHVWMSNNFSTASPDFERREEPAYCKRCGILSEGERLRRLGEITERAAFQLQSIAENLGEVAKCLDSLYGTRS